ncbi:hypothetical protein HHI36_000203 [Cryptolaemus montrouzieri]|uniref:Malate dehydrogenase n=1 Tax=Cryptolaemus montrouzieri TaxID=559131 RepID=A0ABD2P4Q6_9CUCU
MDDGSETIRVSDMNKFVVDCFMAIGVNRNHSELMAESIVGADLVGHHSHGVFRLDRFISDGQSGNLDVHSEPTITKESSATAWVDGHNALGPIVSTFCMKIAIQKAKEVGAAIVVANNSNNPGVVSNFTKLALKEGMIGFGMTNSSPLMLPSRAKEPIAGTNPISLAAPGVFGDYFLLDMATTVVSGGNIEIKYKNGEFLPNGWAVNAACLPESNADVALKSGRFLPVGSYEEHGNYKGSGLSLMVDVLCGALAGAHYSHMVGTWLKRMSAHKANVGHCYIVINPKFFAPGFEMCLTEFISAVRNTKTEQPNSHVRIAGDKGREMVKYVEEKGGIWYPNYVITMLKALAETLKLKCVAFIPKPKPVQLSPSEELAARLAAEKRIAETEQEVTVTEEDLTVPENSLDKDISFIIEDSSEWMCPLTVSGIEMQRIHSRLRETIQKYSIRSDIDIFDRKDEDSEHSDPVKLEANTSSEQLDEIFDELDTVAKTTNNLVESGKENEGKVKASETVSRQTEGGNVPENEDA